jgi:hypothetical protein
MVNCQICWGGHGPGWPLRRSATARQRIRLDWLGCASSLDLILLLMGKTTRRRRILAPPVRRLVPRAKQGTRGLAAVANLLTGRVGPKVHTVPSLNMNSHQIFISKNKAHMSYQIPFKFLSQQYICYLLPFLTH